MKVLLALVLSAVITAALGLYLVGPFLLAAAFDFSPDAMATTMIGWYLFFPILFVIAMELQE